jgi:hypothetical protein
MITNRKLFFPLFGMLKLRKQRGSEWRRLVDRVNALPVDAPEVIAFRLTIDRVRRAQGEDLRACHDPFCANCVSQVVAGFEGDEKDLLALYHRNLAEVNFTIRTMRRRAVKHEVRPAALRRVA